MYEELVTDLRRLSDWSIMDFEDNLSYANQIAEEAADAIEELSRVAGAIPHVCECCIGCEVETGGCDRGFVLSPKRAMEYLSKPRWIPVTERLPEKGKWVLCACRANIFCVMKRDGIDWYENPTHIYMSGFVTHWMPLPEPPKEETK